MINLLYILGFGIVFSIFDYWGYNYFTKRKWCNEKFINPYRIVQTIFQLILIGLAYYFFNWIVAVGFILFWWSWSCDIVYYVLEYFIGYESNMKGGNKDIFKIIDKDSVTWAWWTCLGLYLWVTTGDKKAFTHSQIYWQLIIGNSVIILSTVILNIK